MLTRAGKHKIVLLSRDRVDISVNQDLSLSFDPEKLHIFDTETGMRL